jgi:hypothetical protein
VPHKVKIYSDNLQIYLYLLVFKMSILIHVNLSHDEDQNVLKEIVDSDNIHFYEWCTTYVNYTINLYIWIHIFNVSLI